MKIEIRSEIKEDLKAIYDLNKEAFGQPNESNLIDLLRLGESFISELSLVAIIENKIVGHILFTKIKIINSNNLEFDSLALAPMAVAKKLQKQGIGSNLILAGLKKAKELGYKSVIVLGHKDYYPKFGFESTKKWNIKAPFDVPEEVFMGIELVQNAFKGISGIVKYPKEFELV